MGWGPAHSHHQFHCPFKPSLALALSFARQSRLARSGKPYQPSVDWGFTPRTIKTRLPHRQFTGTGPSLPLVVPPPPDLRLSGDL